MVRSVLERISPDEYVNFLKKSLDDGQRRFGAHWKHIDIMNVLYAAAKLLQPRRYLEIGVRRGRSMAMVLAASAQTELVGFDLWQEWYAGMDNPGPEFVRTEMRGFAIDLKLELISGDSRDTVPRYLKDHSGEKFELITVDGDHSAQGARNDLRNVLPALELGGVVVFDDIVHPEHPYLLEVWRESVAEDGGLATYEYTELGFGVAFGIRRQHRENRRVNRVRRFFGI